MAEEMEFLSTPSARRATPAEWRIYRRCGISIHALREEGDLDRVAVYADSQLISIHALREEGDDKSDASGFAVGTFLSTPSARRATD